MSKLSTVHSTCAARVLGMCGGGLDLLCLSNAHWSKMVECSRRVLHGGAVHSGGLGAGSSKKGGRVGQMIHLTSCNALQK